MTSTSLKMALPTGMTSTLATSSVAEETRSVTPPPAAATSGVALELRHVCKGYGQGSQRSEVLHDINLSIAQGEFVAIVGFSGSGKTTLINLLAGLTTPDSGEVLKDGRPVTGPGPDRGIVFQSYSLMPWLSVRDNVALAVDRVYSTESSAERAERVKRYVAMVGLSAAIDKKPAQLSGGMRQRVSVARALATNPDVLLLDEPLSALDALTRATLQDEIVKIWSDDRKTVLLITNDVDEALMVADRIIPLEIGPKARLGPSFKVDIPRPRDRRAMNHDEQFQALRGEIKVPIDATFALADAAAAHRRAEERPSRRARHGCGARARRGRWESPSRGRRSRRAHGRTRRFFRRRDAARGRSRANQSCRPSSPAATPRHPPCRGNSPDDARRCRGILRPDAPETSAGPAHGVRPGGAAGYTP